MHRRMSQRDLSVTSGRSRSFGGCATCRNRHKKCDETRPTCIMCKDAGVQCGGYDKSIFFDFEVTTDANVARFRRPLLTEEEREIMSEWLTTAVSPRAVMRHLTQIDEECEATAASTDIGIYRGPFGAFRLGTVPVTSRHDLPNWIEDTQLAQGNNEDSEDTLAFASGTLTPRTRSFLQSFLEYPEQEQSSSTSHMWSTIDDATRVEEILDDTGFTVNLPVFRSPSPMPELVQNPQFDFSAYSSQLPQTNVSESLSLVSAIDTNNSVPHDAVHLIKHYSTTVLTLLTPFRHSKTPWHVLFVPHAKSCLAALTLGEDLDHASLCAFYATMSISALSLGGVTQSDMWLAQGNTYLRIAREHVRLMLRTAYDYPKKAKYKHVLIALLSMVQVAIVIGNRDQAECYFVEAEKFIRMKGLNRKKSRKVRLLHHCYVFERMFHESIYIAGTNSLHRTHARKAIEMSGAMAYSHDSLSFRLGDLNDLESQMMRIKCREEGENDLHLQNPGFWPKTLYPEIFGTPEKYVFALSLVIRLGQWRDDAKHQDAADALSLKDFLSRAKTVERYIKQLNRPSQSLNPLSVDRLEIAEPMLDDLLQAMQHALTIYFHRRIYDVDASMLQSQVVSVRDCLVRSEAAGAGTMYGSARLLWPAFIAACEAEDPQVQATFIDWFRNSALRSGLRYFDIAKTNIERVWKGKRNGEGSQVTWVDIMRQDASTCSAVPRND